MAGKRAPLSAGFVYILHFRTPLATGRHHSQHYVGWSRHWAWRVARHRVGGGARIMEVCADRGIVFSVAAVYTALERGGRTYTGRELERLIKRAHHHARYCPLCGGHAATDYRDKAQAAPRPEGSPHAHEGS